MPGKGQRLYRSRTQRMISGVLGGIAEYFSLDPTIVRLAFVGFALIADAGAALVAYIVAAIIMPEEPLSSGDAPPPPPPGS
ncbi:MAG: PspC domain-containing protein [Coriobacteriia bacterium]|nr:PspC domain-containing protein [Coriobacteriia bacterium]